MHLLTCCSLPCISQILQVRIFFSSILPFCRTDQTYLRWPRFFSSDDLCQGSHRLFQSLLCWRWRSLNPCLHLHYSYWWEVQTSRLLYLRRFQTHRDLSAFLGQTWDLNAFSCWFFSDEDEISSPASQGHFQCLVLENFVFLQCSLLIGSTSSLECNQSDCGVVHLG